MNYEPDIRLKFSRIYASVDTYVLKSLYKEIMSKKFLTAGQKELLPHLTKELSRRKNEYTKV